ncbi:MAG: hypothetical protein ACPG8F_09025 [Flavobacteriaceae bacterium]
MKTIFRTGLALLSILLLSCGTSSGVDPHLSVEEQQEEMQVNLVGKWKIRRPQPIGSGKIGGWAVADCTVDQIEFFDNNNYILNLSSLDESGLALSKIYRGKYDLLFEETGDEVRLEKIVLMEQNYLSGSNFPIQGSIATIDEIELSERSVSFRIQLEEGTSEFCSTAAAVALSGDKEEPVAPDAAEDSNHVRFINEWRLIRVTTTAVGPDVPSDGELICGLLEGEYYDRCFDAPTGGYAEDCRPATSITLLISEYGTYLFNYFDAEENLLSTEQGDWRWRTDTEEYTVFNVKDPDETFNEDSIRIAIIELTETSLQLSEIQEGEEGSITLTYSFQLASLDYNGIDCSNYSTDGAGK